MPTSAITRLASGWTRVISVPALATSKRSPASARRNPSAIWLRAELCVQRNKTRCLAMTWPPYVGTQLCRSPRDVGVRRATTERCPLEERIDHRALGHGAAIALRGHVLEHPLDRPELGHLAVNLVQMLHGDALDLGARV